MGLRPGKSNGGPLGPAVAVVLLERLQTPGMNSMLETTSTTPKRLSKRRVSLLLELCVSRTFLYQLRPQLLRPWIPNSARHRRWTPMIHRGRARRTISAGSWFGQWSGGPARTSATNPREKKTCVNRNFAAVQGEAPAEPCQGARQGLALPKIAYRGGYVRRTYLGLIPRLVLARRPPSEVPSSRADHISSGLVRGSHRAASPHRRE